jgi:hypothetical protein
MGPAKIRPPASRSHSWISYEIRAQEALACSLGQGAKSAAVMPAGWPGGPLHEFDPVAVGVG